MRGRTPGCAGSRPLQLRPVRVNGLPGWRVAQPDGTPVQTFAFEPAPGGARVARIYVVRNPDKLQHLRP